MQTVFCHEGEKTMDLKRGFGVLVVLLLAVSMFLNSQNISFGDIFSNDTPVTLDGVQILEYEGKDLTSILNLRDNSISGPPEIDTVSYTLNINGLVGQELSFTYDELRTRFNPYTKVVTLHCVEGWDATMLWEGVLFKDIAGMVGIKGEADTVIFHALDGYTTALSLDYLISNNIMLAYKLNGVTLPAKYGFPLQLVAESKWGYKWIKWVSQIEFSDDENYLGTWERQGYSNDADLNKGFFD
jgi:DMSO/TMAO reductase YedYZ molybdopterin-dependent catalytic subunit